MELEQQRLTSGLSPEHLKRLLQLLGRLQLVQQVKQKLGLWVMTHQLTILLLITSMHQYSFR
jgi:hypothetical protein